MAYQMNITLTDEEYNALAAKVGKDERLLEKHLHTSLPVGCSLSERDMQRYLSQRGMTYRIPTDHPETLEEEAEDKRLADLFGQVGPDGKTVSEMVIEDRGLRE